MTRKRTALTLLTLAAIAAVAIPASGFAGGTAERTSKNASVKLKDDYFSKDKVKIKKGGKVKFKWAGTIDSHNVHLKKAPKSVKGKSKHKLSHDRTQTRGKFKPKFKKPGTYKFICTVHPTTMQITVKVKKPKKHHKGNGGHHHGR